MDQAEKAVLVVEDEPSIREMIQVMLEDVFGVQTIPAEDGQQALLRARQDLPALVLLDIMLPGIDGIEVAKQLRAQPTTQNIPIIAVTASTGRDKVLAAGCDDYIQKPFDVDDFLGKVEKHLASHSPVAI